MCQHSHMRLHSFFNFSLRSLSLSVCVCVCECVQNPFRDPLEDSDEETVVEKKKEEVEGD